MHGSLAKNDGVEWPDGTHHRHESHDRFGERKETKMNARIVEEPIQMELATATGGKVPHGVPRKLRSIVLTVAAGLTAFAVAFPAAGWTQEKPADNMEILRDKIRADKKLLVAANMELTESEANGFWPVYEAYQKDLAALNQRIGKFIESYAEYYRADAMTDKKARKLVREYVAIWKSEAGLRESYVPNLDKVLPPQKVARYLQIENKIRALVHYELAAQIPLVP